MEANSGGMQDDGITGLTTWNLRTSRPWERTFIRGFILDTMKASCPSDGTITHCEEKIPFSETPQQSPDAVFYNITAK
jgi:hypothetical protein